MCRQTRDILERLIGFDTTSNRSNVDMMAYVTDLLRVQGIESVSIPNETLEKTGLIATLGPNAPGGVTCRETYQDAGAKRA